MSVKVDMSKAYDWVEWNFLEAVMEKLGFESQWINLMMMCIRTAHFSESPQEKLFLHVASDRVILYRHIFSFCVWRPLALCFPMQIDGAR